MVWDRCNYSDNIRKPALPPLLFSFPAWKMCSLGQGIQPPCTVLHFILFQLLLYRTFLFTLLFPQTSLIFFLLQETRLSQFSVVCKVGVVPVGSKSNEGKSCCYCAAVDCAPTPHHLY
ncbi:hypothetical protein AMECASPLE_006720 [Ameca splendens]|uniref:Uncharacterized protein n=1 Tax=Ameca splendens TaxID=208324 RepID=A0ABV0Z8A0_9TELE